MPKSQINEGWETRYEEIKSFVHVSIDTGGILTTLYHRDLITDTEIERSSWKINLIEPFLTRMVLNMIKGTIKYSTDNWSTEAWQDMGMDDMADSVNYTLLEKWAEGFNR